MKSLSKKTKMLLIVSSAVSFAIIGLLILSSSLVTNDPPKGMRQVKSYNAMGTCLAVAVPECGYCPGEELNDKCYVKQGTLEQYP